MTVRGWLGIAAGSLALSAVSAADPLSVLPLVHAELVPSRPPEPVPQIVLNSGAPGVGFERTGGYWDWRRGRWVWLPARWERRPDSAARWIPAEYVRQDGSWRYVPGHWSSQRVVMPRRDRARHAGFLKRNARGLPR